MTEPSVAPLKPVTFLVPSATLIVFALIATLPWGMSAQMTYLPPLLVLALIFCWTMRYPNLVPIVLVFLIGIGVDVVTAGPIGFWSFLFLVGYALALRASALNATWPTIKMSVMFVPVAALVGVLAWALGSAYFGRFIDSASLLVSLKWAVIVCPAIAWMTRLIHGVIVVRDVATSSSLVTS